MKRIRGVVLSFSLVFLFTVCLPQFDQQLLAQSTYGLITGAVTDPSGAAIADAQVALTNLGTAEKRTQSTGADGLYSFPNLFPGRYKIEVEKTGFKRFTRPEVVVEINQSARIDVTLQVGEVNARTLSRLVVTLPSFSRRPHRWVRSWKREKPTSCL